MAVGASWCSTPPPPSANELHSLSVNHRSTLLLLLLFGLVKYFTLFSREHCLRIFLHFFSLFGGWPGNSVIVFLYPCISEVGLVVGLLQGNRLTLLPPEVSEGGGGVGVILVSFACHPPSTYFGVILQVHTIEYTLECHSRVTYSLLASYSGVR